MSPLPREWERDRVRVNGLFLQVFEEVADLGEEAFRGGAVGLALARGLELAQQILLAFGQVDRSLDLQLDIEIAARLRAQHAHALAAQTELLAGLRAGGHRDLDASAVDARHLDRAAERRRRDRQRHRAIEMVALALEERVRRDRQEDVEIARRPAAHADFALAGEADAIAVLDARRNVHLQVLLLADAAGAVAALARLLDDLAGAAAGMAGALDREETLAGPHAAGAPAGRADHRLGALLAAGAIAGIAGRRARHANGRLLAGER